MVGLDMFAQRMRYTALVTILGYLILLVSLGLGLLLLALLL